jgi:hypothetical protein
MSQELRCVYGYDFWKMTLEGIRYQFSYVSLQVRTYINHEHAYVDKR